jgi:hypothetical protein
VKKPRGPVQLAGPAVGGRAAPLYCRQVGGPGAGGQNDEYGLLQSDDFELNMGPDPLLVTDLFITCCLDMAIIAKRSQSGELSSVPPLRHSDLAPSAVRLTAR